jgi:hypothetical protein
MGYGPLHRREITGFIDFHQSADGILRRGELLHESKELVYFLPTTHWVGRSMKEPTCSNDTRWIKGTLLFCLSSKHAVVCGCSLQYRQRTGYIHCDERSPF